MNQIRIKDTAYLVSGGEVVEEIPVLARGRQQ